MEKRIVILVVLLVFLIALGVFIFYGPLLNLFQPSTVALEEEDLDQFARFVNFLWYNGSPADGELNYDIPQLERPAGAVYLSLRSDGMRYMQVWETEGNTAEALASTIDVARSLLDDEQFAAVNRLEISLGYEFTSYNLDIEGDHQSFFSNVHRGMWGLEINYQVEIRALYAPTYIVESNRSNSRLIELFMQEHELTDAEFARGAQLSTFQADQVLVTLGDDPQAVLMVRGNVFVAPENVTRESTAVTLLALIS